MWNAIREPQVLAAGYEFMTELLQSLKVTRVVTDQLATGRKTSGEMLEHVLSTPDGSRRSATTQVSLERHSWKGSIPPTESSRRRALGRPDRTLRPGRERRRRRGSECRRSPWNLGL